jgi:RHS repeat-associated protein
VGQFSVGINTTASLSWVLPEANNSTVMLIDYTGAVKQSYAYEPYGKTTASGGADSNSQQYTGRENDQTGLYYYRNRYYMPGCMRFISEDPIGWASGQTNNYAYVGGNPVQLRDPTGLLPLVDDYFKGKEFACLETQKRQWVNWRNQAMMTPFAQLKPSDSYVLQHAQNEIAQIAIQQANILGEEAAKDVYKPSGLTGRGPNVHLGVGILGAGISSGCH